MRCLFALVEFLRLEKYAAFFLMYFKINCVNILNVCCLFALSVFLFNVLHYIFFSFYVSFSFVCLFYFLERKTEKGRKKKKEIKKVKSRIKFSIWKPFRFKYFFRLINQGNGFCN